MEVLISAAGVGKTGDLTSLRAWLESAEDGRLRELACVPSTGDTLGFGVVEICAPVVMAEGLPTLISFEFSGTTED